ncbi:MAG: hypothetical protein Q4E16_01590 [Neisseria sp.]|nr:hypothetical protein [Neisseria sp.]
MMTIIKKVVPNRNTVLIALFAVTASQMALAAGFEAEASAMITNIRTAVYTVVGVVAGLCLLWQFAQGWGGRKTWGDILDTCLWIVSAGAAIALATWLFTKGGSMSF